MLQKIGVGAIAALLLLLVPFVPIAGATSAPGMRDGSAEAAPPAQRRRRRRRRRARPAIPEGRAVGDLDQAGCEAILRSRSVRFERVDAEDAEGVAFPVRLEGPVAGVTVGHRGANRGSRSHRRRIRRLSILDCRLVVSLLAWAPTLRGAGVNRILHYSIYRPGARVRESGRPSGHAAALAIDVGELELDDGRTLVIEEAWSDRRRGVSPCEATDGEDADQTLLRDLVCAAAEADVFQVVLTPHHDEDHENHVHLELRPGVTWSLLE